LAECVTTRQSDDADGGFPMCKAVFTTTRVLFAAGAAGMLGIAMLAAPTTVWASSGGCSSSSPCSLVFATGGQPAGTTINTRITSSFDSPTAGPVEVEIVDPFGNLVTNAKANITVAITPTANPGNGTLSGTKTVTTSNGVASFFNLSIDQPGVGYRLTATSKGLGSVTSDHFTIWSSLQTCSTSTTTSCSATTSSATTSGTVTTSPNGSTQFLGTGIGGGTYSCATYQPVSDPFTFDVINGTGDTLAGQFTAVLRIDKSLVLSSGHPGASTWQLCYASLSQFTAQPGTAGSATIGDVTFFTGLLPDCSTTPVAPCVLARNKNNAGDVLVTFLASGDPIGRG